MLIYMHSRRPSTRPSGQHRIERCVGSYATYWGATLAVEHVSAAPIALNHIEVVANGLRPTNGWSVRASRHPRRRRAVWAGMVASGSGLAIATFMGTTFGVAVVVALIAGVVIGCVYGGVDSWSARRGRVEARASTAVCARRFDVVCAGDVPAAANRLARWWDPDAVPVPGPAAVLEPPSRPWRRPHAAAA